jgi:hypothetical protein
MKKRSPSQSIVKSDVKASLLRFHEERQAERDWSKGCIKVKGCSLSRTYVIFYTQTNLISTLWQNVRLASSKAPLKFIESRNSLTVCPN